MGQLSVVVMGWQEEVMFTTGGNCVWCAELAEDKSTCRSHTNQPSAIEPYIGLGTHDTLLWGF